MALIKLGSIVTRIVGSLGGSTFRRHKNSVVISNKSYGASSSKIKQNSKVDQLSSVINSWSLLSDETRKRWNIASKRFSFLDKFSDTVYLSGFSLYVKLVNHLRLTGGTAPNPSTLSRVIPRAKLKIYNYTGNYVRFIQVSQSHIGSFLLISMVKVSNNSVSPNYKRHEFFYFRNGSSSTLYYFLNHMQKKFPNSKSGDCYIIYYRFQNPDGFRSPVGFTRVQIP